MSNTITIELCAEDRARLDKLTTALEQRVAPAEKVEPAVTLEQIQQKVVQLAASGAEKKAKVREVISTYGTKVSDLKDKPEKWDEVWEKLTALEG